MTKAHTDELVARLRRTRNANIPAIRGAWDNTPRYEPVNPDGPEAADEIERLSARERMLEEALTAADELAAQVNRDGASMNGHIMLELKRYMTKRAALTLPHKEERIADGLRSLAEKCRGWRDLETAHLLDTAAELIDSAGPQGHRPNTVEEEQGG